MMSILGGREGRGGSSGIIRPSEKGQRAEASKQARHFFPAEAQLQITHLHVICIAEGLLRQNHGDFSVNVSDLYIYMEKKGRQKILTYFPKLRN